MNTVTAARWRVQTFTPIVERYRFAVMSFTEEEALKASHWDHGEDARLREDIRFRPTPWGRWILSSHLLANDMIHKQLHESTCSEIDLSPFLTELHSLTGSDYMFCPFDPRFVCEHDKVKLAARELTDRPMVEEPLDIEKYVSHLPLHSLKAVAASEPADEWGARAQEEMIETLGWVRVRIPSQKLNDKMFIAQIKGSSMDNGRNGLTDGSYAVFQLWPVGTRQEKIVLVRGSFRDPETGTYALKKYLGDVRDEAGQHHSIKLISANPDKERYPDIALSPDQDLSVIAELIVPLNPSDYGREPKPRTASGKRDLTSKEAQTKICNRLTQLAQRFLSGESRGIVGEEGTEPSELSWKARFICLEGSAGGLHIEAGPLTGLPPFAKTIQLQSGAHSWKTLASNFRTKNWRVQVTPSSDPYCWSAPGFEEVLDEELASLSLNGLSTDTVTLFRVDAAGAGVLSGGTTVSPGQSYRMLVPQSFSKVMLPKESTIVLENGWRLFELIVPASSDVSLRSMLTSLNLDLGKNAPRLSWVVIPPALYKRSTTGESYPCFHSGQTPILSIDGISCMYDGEVAVFLAGPGPMQSKPLPRDESWFVELADLSPGMYIAEVLHARTRFEPAYVAFSIDDSPVLPVKADLVVLLHGKQDAVAEAGSVVLESDFSLFEDNDVSLEVLGPPLWPATITWESGRSRRIDISSLGEDGSLDLEKLAILTEDLRSRCRVANLVMDFRELGTVLVQLNRETDPEDLQEVFQNIVKGQGHTAEELAGQFQLLRSLWLEPLLQKLNYGVGDIEQTDLAEAPPGISALKLLETSRTPQGKVREELRRILVLTGPAADLRIGTKGSARSFAETLCWKTGMSEAILTDGIRWTLHKRGGKVRPPLWDLRDLVNNPDEFDFPDFLYHFAVGV